MKDNLLAWIERVSGRIHNWAWNERFKERDSETWIEGYNKHKKDYDQWKKEKCPHN